MKGSGESNKGGIPRPIPAAPRGHGGTTTRRRRRRSGSGGDPEFRPVRRCTSSLQPLALNTLHSAAFYSYKGGRVSRLNREGQDRRKVKDR